MEMLCMVLIIVGFTAVIITLTNMADNNDGRNNRISRLEKVLDIKTCYILGSSSLSIENLKKEMRYLTERLNNLPSEKAKVIQQKVDELEEMVKELK